MTDLPQLQTLLVDAAVKRRRRRRVRRVALPALVVAALLATLPWVVRDARITDREVPVATPAPAQSAEEAFKALRKRSRTPQPMIQPGDLMRPLNDTSSLLLRGDELCLIARTRYDCGPAADYVSGHKILSIVVNGRAYAVFPDGVKSVTRTWLDRKPTRFAVIGNLVMFTAPDGAGELEWRAPDGSTRREKLRDITRPRMWYPRLGMSESPLDRELGFPGARVVIGDRDVKAWLVPRHDAVCLVVRVEGDQRSVCRAPVQDTRTPLMVSVPARPQRIVVFAFASSYQEPLTIFPSSVERSINPDAMLVIDGDEVQKIAYRGTLDKVQRIAVPPHGSLLSANDREISPDEIPPER